MIGSSSMAEKPLFDSESNQLALRDIKNVDNKRIAKRHENKSAETMLNADSVVKETTTNKPIKRTTASTSSKRNDAANLKSQPKRTKANDPRTPVASTEANLPASKLQRRPETLVATPKLRTPDNKIVYSKSYIERALLSSNRNGSVNEKELRADSRKIVVKEEMKLYVVPRDIDSKQLEEIKQNAAQDKSIDILSQLREHSTQSIIIAHYTAEKK